MTKKEFYAYLGFYFVELSLDLTNHFICLILKWRKCDFSACIFKLFFCNASSSQILVSLLLCISDFKEIKLMCRSVHIVIERKMYL